MASKTKTKRPNCGTAAVDRLGNLPRSLIELILKHLPVHDVARMSILSKTWRDVWVMHPHLVLDELFFKQLVSKKVSKKDKLAQVSQVSRTISNILLVHTGPILKFHLFIPRDLPLHQCVDVDFWIKNISNAVRKLELFNKPFTAYKIPLYLFSCSELTHLHLTKCILNPPHRFGGFCNLISVKLEDIVITADMSFGTQLKTLELEGCAGIKHLGCHFDNNNVLTRLVILYSEEIDLGWFECIQKVETLMLKAVSNSRNERISFNKLVANMPRINALVLDDFFLEENGVNSSDNMEAPDFMVSSAHMILDKLKVVEMHGIVGSKAEFQLIKFLLASTPWLRRIELYKDTTVDPKGELRILQELLQIPRASTSSKIIWK
ncbi:FBD-associated F-box protein At4g13985-like isoform X2 [Daucus carota subsp. sativus]|uniref:FBD-associated F-box protein At4g13985-like isoform X2 n=1 Tax=Daucus carota subsp. sativus TaxID=79200 RepID=UPI0007EFE661|nr:PREDICTED: FBD-associated F-box protein At4g13985-like isoform X2 [Daucus carota subsp. sativus]